jgi:hypothetical protein
MAIDRRDFIKASAVVGGATLFGLNGLAARTALDPSRWKRGKANELGYGPLSPKPSENTGEVMLALPEGFSYKVFGKTGETMSDGNATPSAHDGMATFAAADGMIRLVRNHEVRSNQERQIAPNGPSYDPNAGGGTTTLVVDPETRELKKDFVSLSGTIVNCAGGPTPWGSWITCEETTVDGEVDENYTKPHGYCFEVPADLDGPADPKPIVGMGRFVHEAIAVDPETGIVYLTEDRGSSGLFRYIPNTPGDMHSGGKLEMLAIVDKPQYDTRNGQTMGQTYPVEWVEIEDVDPKTAGLDPSAIYTEGYGKGGATFGRLEGCWQGADSIFANSTNGGDERLGQVWQYMPERNELKLLFESDSSENLEAPDNLCVSPRDGLLICEDGGGLQYLRGLTLEGEIFDFATNELNESEFAGACFSPDGKTLFVNIQYPGITLAIYGPWERGLL